MQSRLAGLPTEVVATAYADERALQSGGLAWLTVGPKGIGSRRSLAMEYLSSTAGNGIPERGGVVNPVLSAFRVGVDG